MASKRRSLGFPRFDLTVLRMYKDELRQFEEYADSYTIKVYEREDYGIENVQG